jgi:predicted 2-oxoglutarate/Fe(II)-dependent dioxygenase YbiX
MPLHLEDYILVVENALPPEECDAVLAEYAHCSDWEDAKVVSYGAEANVNYSQRNCKIIGSSGVESISKNHDTRHKLDAALFTASGKAIAAYIDKFPFCRISQDSGYDLLKYECDEFFAEHVDIISQNNRVVSCSFALNDSFEGGEFAFFKRRIKYSVPKGAALLFPSTFAYPHEIMPVTRGTRYSAITWFN